MLTKGTGAASWPGVTGRASTGRWSSMARRPHGGSGGLARSAMETGLGEVVRGEIWSGIRLRAWPSRHKSFCREGSSWRKPM